MTDKEIALELTKIALSKDIVKDYIETDEETKPKPACDFAKEVADIYNTIFSEISESK